MIRKCHYVIDEVRERDQAALTFIYRVQQLLSRAEFV